MRRKKASRRKLKPDPLYQNLLLSQLINKVMRQGKKSRARRLVYTSLDLIKEQGLDPIQTFQRAVENVRPSMEVRPRRVGGAAYQVPMPVKGDRQLSLAIRWLVLAARSRPNSTFRTFDQKLATELIEASQRTGGAVKKKDEILRMAEANRAFAHFRW